MKYTSKKFNAKTNRLDSTLRRQAANFERFMQEKADVFQVTDVKDQAMFWTMQ